MLKSLHSHTYCFVLSTFLLPYFCLSVWKGKTENQKIEIEISEFGTQNILCMYVWVNVYVCVTYVVELLGAEILEFGDAALGDHLVVGLKDILGSSEDLTALNLWHALIARNTSHAGKHGTKPNKTKQKRVRTLCLLISLSVFDKRVTNRQGVIAQM